MIEPKMIIPAGANPKSPRAFYLIAVLMLAALALLIAFSGAGSAARADEFDDLEGTDDGGKVDITASEENTRTFINIPLKGKNFYWYNAVGGHALISQDLDELGVRSSIGSRSDWRLTLLIEFVGVTIPNGKFAGSTVMASSLIMINFPSIWGTKCTFKEDLKIYVFDSWYKLFTDPRYGQNISIMNLTLYGKSNSGVANSLPMRSAPGKSQFTFAATVTQEAAPPGIDDPDSPDYDPGGGGGAGGVTPTKSWFQKLFDSLAKALNWAISYETFITIITFTAIGLLALLIAPPIIRGFKNA